VSISAKLRMAGKNCDALGYHFVTMYANALLD